MSDINYDTGTTWTIGNNNKYFPIANAVGEPLFNIICMYIFYIISWSIILVYTKLPIISNVYFGIIIPFCCILLFDFLYTFNDYAFVVDANTQRYIMSSAPFKPSEENDTYYGLEILDTSNAKFLPEFNNSGYVFQYSKFPEFIKKNNITVHTIDDKIKGWFKGTPGAWKKRSSGTGSLRSAADYNSISYAAFYLITVTLTYATVLSTYNNKMFLKLLPLIIATLIAAGPLVALWIWTTTLEGSIQLYAIKVKFLLCAFSYAFTAFLYIF
jgi:hypothetical protein